MLEVDNVHHNWLVNWLVPLLSFYNVGKLSEVDTKVPNCDAKNGWSNDFSLRDSAMLEAESHTRGSTMVST